jgi:hypothetical protein
MNADANNRQPNSNVICCSTELSTGTRSERRNVRVYRPAAPHPHKHFEINDDSVDSFADFTANTKTRRFPPTGDSHPRRGRTEHAAVIALT